MNIYEIEREIEEKQKQLIVSYLDATGRSYDSSIDYVCGVSLGEPQIMLYREPSHRVVSGGEDPFGCFRSLHYAEMSPDNAVSLIKSLLDFQSNLPNGEAFDRWAAKHKLTVKSELTRDN